MSLGVNPTFLRPLSNRLGTNPNVSLSVSSSLEPIPVSTSTLCPQT